MTHSYMTCLICIQYNAFGHAVYVTWLMRMSFVCDMTYSDVLCTWHDSIIYVLCAKWLILCDARPSTLFLWSVAPPEWDMTHSCGTCLIRMSRASVVCNMHHLCQRSFVCDMTRLCVTWPVRVWHDPFVCDMTRLCVTSFAYVADRSCVTWRVRMTHITYITHTTNHKRNKCNVTCVYVLCMWSISGFVLRVSRSTSTLSISYIFLPLYVSYVTCFALFLVLRSHQLFWSTPFSFLACVVYTTCTTTCTTTCIILCAARPSTIFFWSDAPHGWDMNHL